MALIGVCTEPDYQPIDVLACNEEHYILHKSFSFVVVEHFIFLPETVDSICFIVHGNIVTGDTLQRIQNSSWAKHFIENHINSAQSSTPLPDFGIHDFSQTFHWNIPNNKNYEEPHTEIKSNYGSDEISIYNISAKIPGFNVIKLTKTNHFSKIQIAHSGSQKFPQGIPIGFRFGFWLKYRPNHKMPQVILPYEVDLFSFPLNQAPELQQWNLLNSIMYNRFWIKIDKDKHLKPLVQKLREKNDGLEELSASFKRSHSDIYIFLNPSYKLRTTQSDKAPSYIEKPSFIMYGPEEKAINYNLYHFKLGNHFEYDGVAFIKHQQQNMAPYMIQLFEFSPAMFYKLVISFSGIFALGFALKHDIIFALYLYVISFCLYHLLQRVTKLLFGQPF